MADFFFFTDPVAISSPQTKEQAFGDISTDVDRYNLENKFSVSSDAPAFATAKSLLLVLSDQNSPDIVNIALLPINASFLAGFPIAIFIYRGIQKSSLIDDQQNLKLADTSWKNDNILSIAKKTQDKINLDSGTTDVANFNALGLQFDTNDPKTLIEKIFFDTSDDFHPLIVSSGCQIGKFVGNSTEAGIEIVLDRIGIEPTVELLKSSSHIIEFPKFLVDQSWDTKKGLQEAFLNREKREIITNYIDITAFYGACINQGIKIQGVPKGDEFLSNFYNNKALYIDIRDERGYSYNHFFEKDDIIEIGLQTDTNDNSVSYTPYEYYSKWPILKLNDLKYSVNNDKKLHIKFPIIIGSPENLNTLTGYTVKFTSANRQKEENNGLLGIQDRDGNILLNQSEAVTIKTWSYEDLTIGSNYILLKISTLGNESDPTYDTRLWNSFFSMSMNPLFDYSNIENGEFRINTYSSINAMPLVDHENGEIYHPTIGIASDKYQITFFAFKENTVYEEQNTAEIPTPALIDKGKYQWENNADNVVTVDTNQNVGFLHQITNKIYARVDNFELEGFYFEDPQDNSKQKEFLNYTAKKAALPSDDFFRNFEAITLSHEEYQALKNKTENLTDTNIFSEHQCYIKNKNTQVILYEKFQHIDHEVTLGVASIQENANDSFSVSLTSLVEPILSDGEIIAMSGAVINE